MATKAPRTVPKISVKIWKPIVGKLNEKLEKACLRRDAYLAKVLEVELDLLDKEVSIPNSQASYNFVQRRVDELDRKVVSLALPSEVIERLNEICRRKRIVRDAFINRLFLLLAAAPAVVDTLLFGHTDDKWRTDVWSEYQHEGPFFENVFYPLERTIDPFWAIRAGLELFADNEGLEDYIEPTTGKTIRVVRDALTGEIRPPDSLYTTVFELRVRNNDLLGLSCYLPESRVPGTDAEKARKEKLDELLSELGPL